MTKHDKSDSIKKAFPKLLQKSMGIVTTACDKAEISRSTYYEWRANDPQFDRECAEVIEFTGDFVESCLFQKIKNGDTACILFYCKTKLKSRGYIEKHDPVAISGNIIINPADLSDDQLILMIKEMQKVQ